METVLITGLKGFTGSYLARFLAQKGYQIVGLDAASCDITDSASVDQFIGNISPDYVIHLAGISFVAAKNLSAFYETNVIGTLNVIKALAKQKKILKRILVASSAAVYGHVDHKATEESIPAPLNHYGCSKLAMEHLLKPWCKQLPITIVRPFNYTGVGHSTHFLVPKIVMHYAQRENSILLGNLNITREVNDINFAVECYYRLMVTKDCDGEIFNLSGGVGYQLKDLLDCLKTITGHQIEVRQDPTLMRFDEVQKLVGSGDKLTSVIGDIKKPSLKEIFHEMLSNSEKKINTNKEVF